MNQIWIILLSFAVVSHSWTIEYRDDVFRHCSYLKEYYIAYQHPKCYSYISKLYQWYDARDECKKRGGMLWKMDTIALSVLVTKYSFLHYDIENFASFTSVGTVWAGANKKDDFHYWIDGSPITTSYWAPFKNTWSGVLNVFSTRDTCLTIKDAASMLQIASSFWEQEECTKYFTAICEHEIETISYPETNSTTALSSPVNTSTATTVTAETPSEEISSPAPSEEKTHIYTFKSMRHVDGVLNPRLRAPPIRTEQSEGLTDCSRRCSKDSECVLVNVSPEYGCGIYYDIKYAIKDLADSVSGWSVWVREK